MECALIQNCLRGLENCHPVSLCNRDEIAHAMRCGGDNCLIVDGTRLQPCETDDCLNVTVPATPMASQCDEMIGGIFVGVGMPLLPTDMCKDTENLRITEKFPEFDGMPRCGNDLYTSGDIVCFCPCDGVPKCPEPPMCIMEALMCEDIITPTDENGCIIGCPVCASPPSPCPVLRCEQPACDNATPAPTGDDGCPTGCPTCPVLPPPATVSDQEDKSCVHGNKIVPVGWSGPGVGENQCNTCSCTSDGILVCTREVCTVTCATFVCENLGCEALIPAPIGSDGCPTGCARCPDPPPSPPPSEYDAPRPRYVAKAPPPSPPPPRKDIKPPSSPPPRKDIKPPSPPAARGTPVPTRTEYVGKKWSNDPKKNREILARPIDFAQIIEEMAPDRDVYKVRVKYIKYSEYPIKEETERCNARPLVESCVVTGPLNVSRRLLTTVVLYTYNIMFSGENATDVAYAIQTETENAEEVSDVNMTAISDEEFTITPDDTFASSVEVYGETPPLPPSPGTDDEFVDIVYTSLIAVSGTCFVVGVMWWIFKRRNKPPEGEQFIVPDVQDKVMYSQNPIHGN